MLCCKHTCMPQDDREGQELRVEVALAERSRHKQQQAQAAAAADAAAGIDAFEMTLKRLGGSDGIVEQDREGERCAVSIQLQFCLL